MNQLLKWGHICLDCRKYFKQVAPIDKMRRAGVLYDWSKLRQKSKGEFIVGNVHIEITEAERLALEKIEQKYAHTPLCPQCRKPMHRVRFQFKVPRMRDKKAWDILRQRMSKK